ncbi:uncharacterized protein [Dermacentor albipictus]|uniref:uncharacterized protein n=1 Tax=Dermacentor albipictus TaxID=60249 RepID=UPI0031FD877D
MRRPISDDESTDTEPAGSAAVTIATAATPGSCSQFLSSSSRRRPRRRRPRVGSPSPVQRRRRAASGWRAEVVHSSQEYLSAVSTTGDTTTLDESPSSRAATFASTILTTTTTTTPSMLYRDTSAGASMAVQGPSRELQEVAFSLSDDLSDAPVTLLRHVPEFAPRQRDKRASVPADTPTSPQMAMFKGKRRGERDQPAHVPAKRVDRAREGDLPLLIKLQKSISEGNLLSGSPQKQQKRRWKPRESVPFVLSRNAPDASGPEWTPLIRRPDDVDKATEPSSDPTSPASFIVPYGEFDGPKSPRTTDVASTSARGTTTRSQPTTQTATSSLPLGTTDTTAPSGDKSGSSKGSGTPVPAERSSKQTRYIVPMPQHQGQRAASELSGEGDGSVSGKETPDSSNTGKDLFAHWEKVFGKEGFEKSANRSDEGHDDIHEELPISGETSSTTARTDAVAPGGSASRSRVVTVPDARNVIPFEEAEKSLIIELNSMPLKPRPCETPKELPQAQRRSKKGPRRESLGVKRTAAVGNLVERQIVAKPKQDASPKEEHVFPVSVKLARRQTRPLRSSTYSEMHGPEPSSATTRDAAPDMTSITTRDVDLANLRKAAGKPGSPSSRRSKDPTRKRELPTSSHPAPRTPTYKYYMSHSSLSSDKRGPDTSSSDMSTHGREYYKGCLHAGKVLPLPGRTTDTKSLASSLPILEESDNQKKPAPDADHLPPGAPSAAPVPKGRKISPPKEIVEKEITPVKQPSVKDLEAAPPLKEVTPFPEQASVPLQRKASEEALLKPVSQTAIDERKEATPVPKLEAGSIAVPVEKPPPARKAEERVQEVPQDDGGATKLAKPGKGGDILEEKRPSVTPPPHPYAPIESTSKGDLSKLEEVSLGAEEKESEPKKSSEHTEGDVSLLSVEFPPKGSTEGSLAEKVPEEVIEKVWEPSDERKDASETGGPPTAFKSSSDGKQVVEKEDFAHAEAASAQGPTAGSEQSGKSKSGSNVGDLQMLEIEVAQDSPPEAAQGATAATPRGGSIVVKGEEAESFLAAKASDSRTTAKEDVETEGLPVAVEGEELTKRTSSAAGVSTSIKEDKPTSSEQPPSKSEAPLETEYSQPPEEEAGEKTHDEEQEEKPEEEHEETVWKEGESEAERERLDEGGETLPHEGSEERAPVEETEKSKEETEAPMSPLPPIAQASPDVQVKVAFLKPQGDEAYYIALVRIRTIPLLLLFGNILVLIILLVMSYLDLFVYLYVGPVVPPVVVPTGTKKGLGHVCRTIRCGIGGTTLFYAINHSVEPCDSMFQYVCERWIHEPSEKYQKVVLGAEKHVTDDMYSEIRRLVESYYPYAQSGHALGKLAMIYKDCEDFRRRDENGVGPLNKLRQKYSLSDWPYKGRFSGKPEEIMAEYIRDTGSGVFVSVRMIPDPEDAQMHARKLIALECSTFVLPTDMLLTYRTTQKEAIKAYKVYISSVVEDFQQGPSEKMVSNIFAFEVNLAHRCNVQCRKKRLKKIKVSEIGQYTDKDTGINWVKVLKTIVSGFTHEITADTMILVRSVSYFKKLGLLFRDATTKTRAMNYLGWRLMQKFSRHTTNKYRNSYRTFQENVLGQPRLDDWMRCLVDAAEAMPLAIGRVYAELMGYEAADYRALGMMMTLQEGLRHMIGEFKWVQGESKEKVSAIMSKSSITVGYPAWLINDTALNAYYATVPSSGQYLDLVAKAMGANYMNQLRSAATTTDAFSKMSNFIFPSRLVELHQKSGPPRESLLYDIRSNHFAIPSGVMSPPYYVSETTWSMNFGGLGVLVARDLVNEFFHALDAGWMGESERIEFKKSSDCVLTAIGKSSRTGTADEAVMKCGGLVSDLLALRLSYTAYHAYADARDETTLPGLEDKSPDQVFFVAAFRTLCTQLRERYYVPVVREKQQVPELAYLDALMRSMNEFTDAFNCPDGKYRQNVVRECLTGEKSGAARLKSRKRALWNPPNASMTLVETPTDTTPWRTVYKRRYNRTVLKRPLDRTGDAALVRNKF